MDKVKDKSAEKGVWSEGSVREEEGEEEREEEGRKKIQ